MLEVGGMVGLVNEAAEQTTTEPEYLRPAVAARVAMVTTQTLIRWAESGLVSTAVLPSGHRRYLKSDIDAIAKRRPA